MQILNIKGKNKEVWGPGRGLWGQVTRRPPGVTAVWHMVVYEPQKAPEA